ncbi:MAG: hypothetical protein LBR90_04295 [Elusimicrobiota bacterium]|jgi:hypothetical protein|nr:hypothetical protein [Elusimicrobiota bacterium]
MNVSTVSQHSVFLVNEPGALKKFVSILYEAGLDIIGIASDIRYEAAVVKFVTSGPDGGDKTTQLIIKNGYTSVKTDVICVQTISHPGAMSKISEILGDNKINITTIYGSAMEGQPARLFLVVDDLEKTLEVLGSYRGDL